MVIEGAVPAAAARNFRSRYRTATSFDLPALDVVACVASGSALAFSSEWLPAIVIDLGLVDAP
jgi:hypothetical protein